jgi:hypothetical protein
MITEDRFRALAEAYGADMGRWPADERAAAAAFAVAHAELAASVLDAEHGLDIRLGAFAIEPSPALRQRVIAAAPRVRAVARAWRWIAAGALGLGLAGSAAAGVAAGMTLAPTSVTRLISGPPPAPSSDALADPVGDVGAS